MPQERSRSATWKIRRSGERPRSRGERHRQGCASSPSRPWARHPEGGPVHPARAERQRVLEPFGRLDPADVVIRAPAFDVHVILAVRAALVARSAIEPSDPRAARVVVLGLDPSRDRMRPERLAGERRCGSDRRRLNGDGRRRISLDGERHQLARAVHDGSRLVPRLEAEQVPSRPDSRTDGPAELVGRVDDLVRFRRNRAVGRAWTGTVEAAIAEPFPATRAQATLAIRFTGVPSRPDGPGRRLPG